MESDCFVGIEFSTGDDEKVLELDSGSGYTSIFSATELFTECTVVHLRRVNFPLHKTKCLKNV